MSEEGAGNGESWAWYGMTWYGIDIAKLSRLLGWCTIGLH